MSAEPVGIVGTAAGVVSLGLQLYAGISKFLNDIKARDGDISSATQHAEGLKNALDEMKTSAARVPSSRLASGSAALTVVNSCEGELRALEKLLDQLRDSGAPPADLKGKLKEAKKKLCYPYCRDELLLLEERLQKVNGVLQTALITLCVESSAETERMVSQANNTILAIHTNTTAAASSISEVHSKTDAIDTAVSSIQHDITAVHDDVEEVSRSLTNFIPNASNALSDIMAQATARQATLHQVSEQSTRILENTRDLSRNGAQIQTRLESFQLTQQDQFKSMNTSMNTRFDQLEEIITTLVVGSQGGTQPLQRLLEKPSNLRTLCDEFLPQDNDLGSSSNLWPSKCNCIRRDARSFYFCRWGPLSISSRATSHEQHVPECPLSNVGKRSMKKYRLQLTGLKGMLSTAIQVMFSIPSGAGGGGLGMNFTYFATVDQKTCPTYQILFLICRALVRCDLSQEHVNSITESAANRILWCFATRRASPTDITIDGSSLMHSLTAGIPRHTTCGLEQTKMEPRAGVQPVICLAKSLLQHRVPVDIVDSRGDTALTRGMDHVGLAELLIANGVEPVASNTWRGYQTSRTINNICNSRRVAEALDSGPLSLAILDGDEAQVHQLVKSHPSTLQECNLLRHTPLHFAIFRPSCLQALLDGGPGYADIIEATDHSGWTALGRSIRMSQQWCENGDDQVLCGADCSCAKSTDLLLKVGAGAPTDFFWPGSFRCCMSVLRHLKERRTILKQLALRWLPRDQRHDLGLNSTNVLDTKAYEVARLLMQRNITIPMPLCVDGAGGSVYHRLRGKEIAEFAFRLGFRDIPSTNKYGRSELLYHLTLGYHNLPYLSWMIEHGADLSATSDASKAPSRYPNQNFNATAAHYIGNVAAKNVSLAWLSRSARDAVLDPERVDSCNCRCSVNGCTPFTTMLKGIMKDRPGKDEELITAQASRFIKEAATLEAWQIRIISIPLIRFLTFESLELRHTCCKLHWHWDCVNRYTCQEEIQEIHNEEESSPELFEDLVDEFAQGYDFADDLETFIFGPWAVRMKEVRDELNSKKLTEEDIRAAEDIGVAWDSSSEDSNSGNETSDDDLSPTTLEYWMREMDKIVEEPPVPIVTW